MPGMLAFAYDPDTIVVAKTGSVGVRIALVSKLSNNESPGIKYSSEGITAIRIVPSGNIKV